MKLSTELLKGSARTLILAVLQDGEMYGYQIIKEIKTKSTDAFHLSEGSIYPALHELEAQSHIKSRWDRVDGKRPRKYYAITPKGKKLLAQNLSEWKSFSVAANSVYKNFVLRFI